MNCSLHLVGLLALTPARGATRVRVTGRRRRTSDATDFPAPVLPTPTQLHGEVPFTANFPARIRSRRG